jgi:hypothetical protein
LDFFQERSDVGSVFFLSLEAAIYGELAFGSL